MPAHTSERAKTIGTVLLIVGIATAGILAAVYFLGPVVTRSPLTITPATTSKIVDGVTGLELDDQYFEGILWETTDPDEFLEYKSVKNWTSGVSIVDSIIDDATLDNPIFVLTLNGTHQHDEDLWDDDQGDRVYYPRGVIIHPGQENIIKVYETPKSTFINLINGSDFTGITNLTATPITTATNVSIVLGINQSQETAMWIRQKDYEAGITQAITVIVNFNSSITQGVFTISGMAKDNHNSTALEFEITDEESLGHMPRVFSGYWRHDLTDDYEIESIELKYGDMSLANVTV